MQKKDWVAQIEKRLESQLPFTCHITDDNKAPLLFACDVFRRRRHDVTVSLDASHTGKAVLHVCISCDISALEFTVRRNKTHHSILDAMMSPTVKVVTIRGCGTVLNTVCKVVETAIHTGWFIEKNVLNTLVLTNDDDTKQRNTTLLVVLRRGSDMSSI